MKCIINTIISYENNVPLLFNVGMQWTNFVQNESSMNMVHSYNEIGSKDSWSYYNWQFMKLSWTTCEIGWEELGN
jgi:hypothetical protein